MKCVIPFFLLLCLPWSVLAESRITETTVYEKNKTLYVDVTSNIELPENIQQAIHSGLILFFEYEFEVKSKKWFKIQPIAKLKKQYILSYHRMTGEYQVENPVTYQRISFKSLSAATQLMQHLQQFPLLLTSQLPQEGSLLRVKFRLSAENLPAIVKLERLFNKRWKIDSDWTVWRIP